MVQSVWPLCGATHSASAFTAADADQSFSAYRDAFYFTRGTNGYFRATTAGGKIWFWERAEQMEMLLDVYERNRSPLCLTMFSNVFNGFISDHGSNWSNNPYNDDIMWMVIACARGFQHTGNPAFRDAARANFDQCYDRAWSSDLGGGLWWTTTNHSKNACVNGPAAIAAHLLYQIYDETNYLTKSKSLYLWERATLFNTNTGGIYDSIDKRGKVATFTLTYNQGTFIGAANFLGYTNDAALAADYTKEVLCKNGIMPRYRHGGDAGGFNGICARWLGQFMKQRELQGRYQEWLQRNAEAAWSFRRLSDNLSWSDWRSRTPAGILNSWGCSSSVVILQVASPAETVEASPGLGRPGGIRNAEDVNAVAADSPGAGKTGWRGLATNAEGVVLATISVNVADTPDLADWGRRAGGLCVDWYPKLATLLASEGFTPPKEVHLNFRNDYAGVAATSGDRIDISADYVRRATNDFGMVIHELVHVMQAYPQSHNPGWLVEGVADHIRLTYFEPQARRPRIDPDRASYRDSYKTTAIFLEWVEKHYDQRLVTELNRAMRAGKFQMKIFPERTGKMIDELWAEFAAALRSQER